MGSDTVLSTISIADVLINFIDGTYSITITENEAAFIKNALDNNAVLFQDISTQLNSLVNQKKITVIDIPNIISIISIAYKENLVIQDDLDIYNIIEITIICILYANVFNLPEQSNEEIINLVKVSIFLLKTNMNEIKTDTKKSVSSLYSFFNFCSFDKYACCKSKKI